MAGEQTTHQPVEMLHPRSLKYLSRYLRIWVRGRLWLQVVIGMVCGILLGYGLGPAAGLVPTDMDMLKVVLFAVTAVGIQVEGIVLIMGVDRILDMCRTVLNVTGDMVASTVMDRWVGGARPLQMELAAEARRESIRRETGEDIIITKH